MHSAPASPEPASPEQASPAVSKNENSGGRPQDGVESDELEL